MTPTPRVTTRTLIALGVLALTVVVLGGVVGRRTPTTPTPVAAASPTASPTPTTTEAAYTPTDYTNTELAFLQSVDYETTLEDGRAVCGLGEDVFGDIEPPTLDSLIESADHERATIKAAITHLCPRYLPLLRKARGGFTDGTYTVGEDIKPGTYRTTPGRVTDCYWERSAAGGGTIANDFVTNAPRGVTVTLRAGEGFTSRECGNWIRA